MIVRTTYPEHIFVAIIVGSGEVESELSLNVYVVCDAEVCTSHVELILVEVLLLSIGVFNHLSKDDEVFEEEHMSLSALLDELSGLPHLESVLKDQVSLRIQVKLKQKKKTIAICIQET